MAAEKRTIHSEVSEFFVELKAAFRKRFVRGRAQPISEVETPRSETLTPDTSEITFTPLTLEAEENRQAGPIGGTANAPAPVAIVCPITRQTLNPASKMYQCRQCGIYYSTEGWEFLRHTAKGQCCGCRGVNTVLPVVRVR